MLLWVRNLRFKAGGVIGRLFKSPTVIVLPGIDTSVATSGTVSIILDQAPLEIC